MIKLEDKLGNEIEVTQDYSGAEVLYEGIMYFGADVPEGEIKAVYFFNDLYKGLESVANGEPFSAINSPYSKDEIYTCLVSKGFFKILEEHGYSGDETPYFDGSDGIFTHQISYRFLGLNKEKQELLLELCDDNSNLEYIVRIDADDFVDYINEAKDLLNEEGENIDISDDQVISNFFNDSDFLCDKKGEINSSVGIGTFEDSLNFFSPFGTSTEYESNIETLLKFMDECAAEVGEEFRYLEKTIVNH